MRYNNTVGNINIKINTDRFDTQFVKAQKKLDILVLKDCTSYVPFANGQLKSSGHIVEDGIIEWNTPYAHYMYMGELYLAANGSSWARKYEKKYPSGERLNYHEQNTGAKWFEVAKQAHGAEWISTVKRIAGGN